MKNHEYDLDACIVLIANVKNLGIREKLQSGGDRIKVASITSRKRSD